MRIIQWGCFGGFVGFKEDGALPENLLVNKKAIVDPTMAIEAMLHQDSQEERTLFVVKGLQSFFNNPRVVRGLQDLAFEFHEKRHTVILLSPELPLISGLDSVVSLVDFPLPNEAELGGILEGLILSQKGENGDKRFKNNLSKTSKIRLIQALKGLGQDDALGALKEALVASGGCFNDEAIKSVLAVKQNIIAKSGVLEFYQADCGYEDIGGLNQLKEFLSEAEFSFMPEAKEFGVEPVRGVIIAGIPGTGKSLAAKACAGGRFPRPLMRLAVSELLAKGGGIVGQGQAKLHQAIKTIEAVSPAVVWIDEIDKAFGGGSGEMDGGTRRDMLGDMLTWMQETAAPVFIVATANNAAALPPELVRRFDECFFVELPGPKARAEIFKVHLKKRRREPVNFDLAELVKRSKGYTGAEIENAIKRGLRKAMANGRILTDAHLLASLKEIKPIALTMKNQLDYYRQWEARPADTQDAEEELNGDSKDLVGNLIF